MSLKLSSTSDLIRIATAGGGFRVEVNLKSVSDLIRIAAAAKTSGAQLFFCNCKLKSTSDLIRIATAGGGCVCFED